MKKKSLVANKSEEARKQIITVCKPSAKTFEIFEQKIKQLDLSFDFWIIAKWAVDSYLKQKAINEHKKHDFEVVKDFNVDALLQNQLDKIKEKAKGFSIKQSKLKPIVTAYSPHDPNDTGRPREPINELMDEMMLRLDHAGLSNHHRASEITSEFISIFFPREYPYGPETIRANYIRFRKSQQ